MGTTSIEWTNLTWNPLTGCTRVSEGCNACYAFALHDRRHDLYVKNNGVWHQNGNPMPKQYAQPFNVIQLLPDRVEQPLYLKAPKRIFVNSMSDLFHKDVPDEYILRVFEVMNRASWHTFQVLTKRPGRLRRMTAMLPWSSNICIGVSIESNLFTPRANAVRPLPHAIHMLSLEPLLGPLPSLDLTDIHWVICGGESGPNPRPCDPEWVRDLRDRCLDAGVAFFFKQWGGRTPKAGGRMLDGRTWDQFPMARGEVSA
jgi:protein gp37